MPGTKPELLPGLLLSDLPVRSVSFRFSSARYLRFCSRVLTALRAVTNLSASQVISKRPPKLASLGYSSMLVKCCHLCHVRRVRTGRSLAGQQVAVGPVRGSAGIRHRSSVGSKAIYDLFDDDHAETMAALEAMSRLWESNVGPLRRRG